MKLGLFTLQDDLRGLNEQLLSAGIRIDEQLIRSELQKLCTTSKSSITLAFKSDVTYQKVCTKFVCGVVLPIIEIQVMDWCGGVKTLNIVNTGLNIQPQIKQIAVITKNETTEKI